VWALVLRSHCENVVLTLSLPEGLLEVDLVRRVRKSIGIRIVAGRVEVIAHPKVPLAQLQQLLQQKRDWILRHLQRQQASLGARQQQPDRVFLAGVPLVVVHRPQMAAGVLLQPGQVLVGGVEEQIKPQLGDFLRQQAHQLIPVRFAAMHPLAVRSASRLQLSSARTRWGSCSEKGVIRLNWRLVQAPAEIVDYVIAHELAHLRHMNHSAAFWNETARMFSNWKNARIWLKTQGESLFLFG
jgi:predicted metal-dependent hydrolase